MSKIILVIVVILSFGFAQDATSQTLKKPVSIGYMMQTDTGTHKDSLIAVSKVYVYPCGQGKWLKSTITPKDTLTSDSLMFFAISPTGRIDTMAFKIWRNDSLKTVCQMPKSASTDIVLWEAYPSYKVVCVHVNQVYNALRKWINDWVLINGY